MRPALGKTLLANLKPPDIQAVYDDLHERGLSAVTIRHLHVPLKCALKRAVQFEKPKTAKSRRAILLPQPLLTKLATHKKRQAEQRLLTGPLWQVWNLVFCSEIGTPLRVPGLTYRYFRPLLERAGLPQIRLNDLRHSQATILLMTDENPKVVSERLGHSTVRLTLDTYSHVLPTMQERATEN